MRCEKGDETSCDITLLKLTLTLRFDEALRVLFVDVSLLPGDCIVTEEHLSLNLILGGISDLCHGTAHSSDESIAF